jgi:hypothetical protein
VTLYKLEAKELPFKVRWERRRKKYGCSQFQALSLSLRMPFVAKKDETDILAVASNVSCQTRGELVFSVDAAKTDKSQPASVTEHTQTNSAF